MGGHIMSSESRVLSRRNLVVGAAAATAGLYAAGASALGTTWFRTAEKVGADMLGITLTPEGGIAHWRSLIGQSFAIAARGTTVTATLREVQALHDGGEERPLGLARDEAFCCVFDTGRQDAPAGEAVYQVSHTELGRAQIRMRCCAAPKRLEAVFN